MIMETSSTFVKFCFLVLVVVWGNEVCVEAGGGTFDVTKYGAISNGETDNSKVVTSFFNIQSTLLQIF